MGNEWYYSKNSTKHGPVAGAELKALAEAGKLLPTDLVWKEGMSGWKPASSVKGLFPAGAAAASPPPPSPHATPAPDLASAAKGLLGAAAATAKRVAAKATETAKDVQAKAQDQLAKAVDGASRGGGLPPAPPLQAGIFPMKGRSLIGLLLVGGVLSICVLGLVVAGVVCLVSRSGGGSRLDSSQVTGDLALMQGKWQAEGTKRGDGFDTETTWTVEGDQVTDEFRYIGPKPHLHIKEWKPGYQKANKLKIAVDESVTPPRIRIQGSYGDNKSNRHGIYRVADRQLVICSVELNLTTKSEAELTDEYLDHGFPRDIYDDPFKQEEIRRKSGVMPVTLRFTRIGEPPAVKNKQTSKTQQSGPTP